MSTKKKGVTKKAADPAAALKQHDIVWQHHMVLGLRLAGDAITLSVVEPGVSNAPVGSMTVPAAFGRKLCPGMVLKTTLSIVGMYQRSK